jgi:hypothetical protein
LFGWNKKKPSVVLFKNSGISYCCKARQEYEKGGRGETYVKTGLYTKLRNANHENRCKAGGGRRGIRTSSMSSDNLSIQADQQPVLHIAGGLGRIIT